MKTYTKQIESPVLEISYDNSARNPRLDDDCLGYFITVEKNYDCPDDGMSEVQDIVKESGHEANNGEEHMDLIKKRVSETINEKVIAVYPVYKHEHGGVVYRRGTAHGFDYSNCGFYIVTDKSAEKTGTEKKYFENVIDNELEMYTAWVNGEVYAYSLYDENGVEIENCGGFYDIEHIRETLGVEWKNEKLEDYMVK